MPFGDMSMNKKTLIINSNSEAANSTLSKETDERSNYIQHFLDIALLEKGLLSGSDLERFIEKAKSFIK